MLRNIRNIRNLFKLRGVINSDIPMESRFVTPSKGIAFHDLLYFNSRLSSLLSNTCIC